MAARLIEEDPALAHEHALSAARKGGRIGVVRESLAITAYAVGDFALALRELRTYRRITGNDDELPMMVDSERGLGRPEKGLELGRSVDRASLQPAVRVELAIAMSGARLDLGQAETALSELRIPELDPNTAYSWSASLFAAYATVLDELGRTEEAEEWWRRADIAAEAFDEASGDGDVIELIEEDLDEDGSVDEASDTTATGSAASDTAATDSTEEESNDGSAPRED
jgi:tetratricopeptide (TPR) repeat protein